MGNTLIDLLDAFNRLRVLVIGDFLLDSYMVGDAERVSPEAPVPVLKVVSQDDRPGGAGATSAALAALGVRVICCGVVGADGPGRRLGKLLKSSGCNVDGLIGASQRPTDQRTRLVGLAQHRHRQQLIRVDQVHRRPLDPESRAQLVEAVRHATGSVEAVCLTDSGCGVVEGPLAEQVIAAATDAGRPVLVDPSADCDPKALAGATGVVLNRTEIQRLAGQSLDGIAQLGEAAARLVGDLGLGALVVTLDREGALLVERDRQPEHVPTTPQNVYDNTGAGEVFAAGLAAVIAAKAPWLDAVELANVAAGLEVQRFGCVPITREEVVSQLLARQRRPAAKLRTLDELLVELKALRHQGRTVVFTNGCFDVLHPGHIDYFEFCSRQGDVVIVGLDSDQSVRSLSKGSGRPIFNQYERARMLSGLQAVDFICIFDDGDPTGLMRAIRPDILVKGAQWGMEGVVGREIIEAQGGRVVLAPMVEREGATYSTTSVVERIRSAIQQESPPS
ncbi:MAG TPA: PfkB family carbohydrate kinase [Phycisphaerae bacterium]|nr:PfkB family carbohydrate kinase [Phycisphaerae bacterium]